MNQSQQAEAIECAQKLDTIAPGLNVFSNRMALIKSASFLRYQNTRILELKACHSEELRAYELTVSNLRARLEALEQGKCLHQIAEPAVYPELPAGSMAYEFISDATVYNSDEMRAYVDADRAQRAVAPAVPQAMFDALLAAEHELSNSYVRIRELLGAMNPPKLLPSAELYAYVEGVAREKVQPTPEAIAATKPARTDDELRTMWRAAGGEFHGPTIETGTMPEVKLLPFLRALAQPAAAPQAD